MNSSSVKPTYSRKTSRLAGRLPLAEFITGIREDIETFAAELGLTFIQRVMQEEIRTKTGKWGEQEIYRHAAINEGKPAQALDKIVAGRVEKYYKDNCLLDQPYIRSDKQTVRDLINEVVGKLGERIVVRRFTRYRVGEGA